MEGARRPGESGDDGRGDDDLDSAGSNGYELNTADDHEPSRSYMGSLGNDGGGDGDGGRPTTMNDWKSQLHRTRVKLRLKLNTGDTYAVTICSTFKVGCI
jgi:hypothetical protein